MSRRAASAVLALGLSSTLAGCVNVGGPVSTASSTTAPLESSGPIQTPVPVATGTPGNLSTPGAIGLPVPGTPVGVAPIPSVGANTASGAGSIVFIKAGDVWLAAPDGSAARQLTTDGSQTGYHDPSQSPDGTIYALHGPSTLVALDRATGAPKSSATLPTLENGAEGLVVAPDGGHIAYTTTGFGKTVDPRFGTPNGAFIYGGTDVATPDGRSVPNAAIAGGVFPEWVDASTLVVSDGTKLYLGSVGGQPSAWLDLSNGCLTDVGCPTDQGPAANLTDPAISRDGRVIAAVYKPYYGDGGRLVGRLDAPPPSDPSTTCMLPDQTNYSDPGSFSPDSASFAYDDTTFDPNTLESTIGQGIYVVQLNVTATDCGASNAKLVIPGGAQPEWGPLAP